MSLLARSRVLARRLRLYNWTKLAADRAGIFAKGLMAGKQNPDHDLNGASRQWGHLRAGLYPP